MERSVKYFLFSMKGTFHLDLAEMVSLGVVERSAHMNLGMGYIKAANNLETGWLLDSEFVIDTDPKPLDPEWPQKQEELDRENKEKAEQEFNAYKTQVYSTERDKPWQQQ